MALKLKLKPHEKAIINGAVIENGPRSSEIVVHNMAQILREPSVMQAEDANTPARRTYFAIQLMLIDQENAETYRKTAEALFGDLRAALTNPSVISSLDGALAAMNSGNCYRALQALKDVIAYEAALLGFPSGGGVGSDAPGRPQGRE
ncbi:MAG: flagellar biosynthesis repressor FlbT [Rhodospirillaceae bacterium]